MEPIGSAIAANLVSDFIRDALKSAGAEETSPLTEAIESTARYFEGIANLDETLRQWLRNPRVAEILKSYVEGQAGRNELQISALASTLTHDTQFYLGEDSAATATQVIQVFLGKIRAAYLTGSPISALHIANRQEARFDVLEQRIQHLTAGVETAGGLKTSLQTHFDEAAARMEAEELPAATALFESLLVEINRAPVRDRNLERRVHINLANVALRFFEEDRAVKHFRAAAELDDDQTRAALNSAIADLTEQKPQEAMRRLEAVHDAELSSFAYEYTAAKVRAFLQLKRYGDAVELARSVHVAGKEARCLELLGLAYRESGLLGDAEQAYREALALEPSRPELQHCLADTLTVPAINHHNQHPGKALPAPLKARIDNAATLLESAAARFRTQGRRRAAFEVDSALAAVRTLQGRFQDVIRVLEPRVQSGAATAADWRRLGFAYIKLNEPESALAAFKNAITKCTDPETEFVYAEVLLMCGRPDDALEFASERAAAPASKSNARWHLLKSRALAAKRQFSQAREVISAVQRQLPNDGDVLLTSAELYDTTAQYPEAKIAFEKALENATGAAEIRVRHAFGGFAARQKDFGRAAELWKPLIQHDKPDDLLDMYVRVAYNSQKFSEITSIAESIRNSGARASAVFADVASATYQSLDELVKASYWLEYLGNRYGNRPEQIVRLSNIKLRLGERDQAIELLNASRATLKDAKDIMGFAQAYSILGRHRDAIQLGHEAALAANDADTQLAYVEIFLSAPDELERSSEEIAKFQEILLKFKERFPKSPRLQSFQIDPERPLDALRETLAEASRHTQDAVEIYRHKRMPMTMFAKILGKDLYHTWLSVIADPDLTLFSSDGSEQEHQDFQQILASGNDFLVEPITLFTFSHLGLLDKLARLGSVYIAQRSPDQLHELQARRRTANRQTGVMGIVEGKLFIQEITPEEAGRINSALNEATEWAEKQAKVVGLTEPLSKNDKKWAKLLGTQSVATMITAKQRDLVLVTDDKTLGDIAKQNYGTRFVNTQAALSRLLASGAITRQEFDIAVLKLFEAGYTLTRVNDAHLFTIISEEQFQLTERVKRALHVFEPATIALVPACAGVAGLLHRIYLEAIPDEMRERLALYMLDTLATNHPKSQVKELLRKHARQRAHPIPILQLAKMEQMLNRW